MHFTQKQVTEILRELASTEGGTNELLRMSLEAIMLAERGEHNASTGDSGNGLRSRKTLGRGKRMGQRQHL